MDGVDITGNAADEIARLFLIVVGKRKPLDMGIERPPQVVHDPLADAGGEILFRVGAKRIRHGNEEHRKHRKFQDGETVASHGGEDEPIQPAVHGL